MTNFAFLHTGKDFSSVTVLSIATERILHIDPVACAIKCHWAMEFAMK